MKVLESVAPPGATTKYIDQVVKYAPEDLEFVYFSWPRAIFSNYDVFHVHWPEFLIRNRSRVKRAINEVGFRMLLHRLAHRGTRVVRTVHNLVPHQAGNAHESLLLERLDRLVTTRVVLSQCTAVSKEVPARLIRHGDYVEQFRHFARKAPTPGRLINFGRIEPYKGVIELMDRFAEADRTGLHLRIVGRASKALEGSIISRVQIDPEHMSARLEFVDDRDLVAEVTASELVVLPYREMHNSGVLLVALSLGRPVLVPRGCVNENIAEEVGPGWIIQYDGEMTTSVIRDALTETRRRRSTSPDLSARSWERVATEYADVFRLPADEGPVTTVAPTGRRGPNSANSTP